MKKYSEQELAWVKKIMLQDIERTERTMKYIENELFWTSIYLVTMYIAGFIFLLLVTYLIITIIL